MNRGITMRTLIAGGLTLLCAVLWMACTPINKSKPPPVERSDEPYDFTKEGKIPPIMESDIEKQADIEEIPVADDDLDYEEVAPQIDSTFVVKKKPVEPVLKEGFRVQVFAAGTSLYAEEMRQKVAREFSMPAYITPIDDMYKVRIGDFTTREAAERFLQRCRGAGYKDAWIVQTMVRATDGAP